MAVELVGLSKPACRIFRTLVIESLFSEVYVQFGTARCDAR